MMTFDSIAAFCELPRSLSRSGDDESGAQSRATIWHAGCSAGRDAVQTARRPNRCLVTEARYPSVLDSCRIAEGASSRPPSAGYVADRRARLTAHDPGAPAGGPERME